MSLIIDKKYAGLVSHRLSLFKWKRGNTSAVFRCPICGDSDKNKIKCRGGFYPAKKGDYLKVGCFNCNHKYTSFSAFLKHLDPTLYGQYILEIFKDKNSQPSEDGYAPPDEKSKVKPKKPNPLDFVPSIASLPKDHEAVKYLASREIPSEIYSKLFYTDNYKKWINQCVTPDKFKRTDTPDKRIIIPYYDTNGRPFAYQGRYIGDPPEGIERYITINPNPDKILLYGVERIDDAKPVNVVEGAFDSYFIPNCVAVGGSALTKLLQYKKLDLVFIFDNEPRSKEICELMEKVIEAGRKIVIWPSSVDGLKDINKMVENGHNPIDIVNDNVYTGPIAGMRYQMWKKI